MNWACHTHPVIKIDNTDLGSKSFSFISLIISSLPCGVIAFHVFFSADLLLDFKQTFLIFYSISRMCYHSEDYLYFSSVKA